MDEKERQLQELLTSKEELAGSIAHELKGFISGIEGGFYLMESGEKKGKPERVEQGRDMVKRNLARLHRTVGCALHYVKDRPLDPRLLEIPEVVGTVAVELQARAEHRGIVLDAVAEDGAFEADPFAVHALLVQVVEHALEACHRHDPEAPPVEVGFAARTDGDTVVFDVLAPGVAMAEEARRAALGSRYAPVEGDRSHLGLFIAHRLVRAHGGRMEIGPSEGESPGTRFRIELPKRGEPGRSPAPAPGGAP